MMTMMGGWEVKREAGVELPGCRPPLSLQRRPQFNFTEISPNFSPDQSFSKMLTKELTRWWPPTGLKGASIKENWIVCEFFSNCEPLSIFTNFFLLFYNYWWFFGDFKAVFGLTSFVIEKYLNVPLRRICFHSNQLVAPAPLLGFLWKKLLIAFFFPIALCFPVFKPFCHLKPCWPMTQNRDSCFF